MSAQTDQEKFLTQLAAWLLLPFFMGYVMWAEAFVLLRLWRWFAEPLGYAALTWHSAVGAILIFGILGPHSDPETKPYQVLLRPWFALIFGVVLHGVLR